VRRKRQRSIRLNGTASSFCITASPSQPAQGPVATGSAATYSLEVESYAGFFRLGRTGNRTKSNLGVDFGLEADPARGCVVRAPGAARDFSYTDVVGATLSGTSQAHVQTPFSFPLTIEQTY
jgi:hypothetical protein